MNGVQTRFKCKLDVKRCKRFVFPPSSLLPRSNALKTKAIRYFQTDRTLTRIVSPPLDISKKENEAIADKYEVTWSSLFVNGWKDGKENVNNMTEFSFSNARNAPDKFKEGIKSKIDELLKQL